MAESSVSTSTATSSSDDVPRPDDSSRGGSFIGHARLVGAWTLVSRIAGLLREMVTSHFIGVGLVGAAFNVAFMVPNLFRKLFGEGGLSAAFIPQYAQMLKDDAHRAHEFAVSVVNLLVAILLSVTLLGEVVLVGLLFWVDGARVELALSIKLAMVMLPYVLLICGGAFLGGILQVHKRFGPPAFAPIILNICHIAVVLIGATLLGIHVSESSDKVIALQTTLAYWLSGGVLLAGVLQVAVLLPALRQIGFRFTFVRSFWTPLVRKVIILSIPVAIGAGVLQLSVLADKSIGFLMSHGVAADGSAVTHATLPGGYVLRLPMQMGAPVRLSYAQVLYQFPLGIFAIALATAIFPALSRDAMDKDRSRFKKIMRQGIEASLWEGLPASAGLILVAEPISRLLFQHGQVDAQGAALIARSVVFYSAGIWAFSLQQILNRAYYALRDMKTPLILAMVTLVINVAVELPLIYTPLGESGIAAGTTISFYVQSVIMLWLLDRRIGGLELRQSAWPILRIVLATTAMTLACLAVRHLGLYPQGNTRADWIGQLIWTMGVGGVVYFAASAAMGMNVLAHLLPHKRAIDK